MSTATVSVNPVERFCREQHIGVFGHRGVGKTTFLTMLYREAVGGRLPDLRLGAADATTANYLHDRILQLEKGEALPATLAETDLRFHLYHQGSRQELLIRDYQGEHVGVGKEESIRDYLRDCDAILLCLDPQALATRSDTLRREQEVEQVVEDYLKLKPGLHRPMALIVTKSDLLALETIADEQAWLSHLISQHLGSTAHALREHAPSYDYFAVSSLGRSLMEENSNKSTMIANEEVQAVEPVPDLQPENLDLPLRWLAESLRVQDEARMEQLWNDPKVKLDDLRRCVKAFAERHPQSPRLEEYNARLKRVKSKRLQRRSLLAVVGMLLLSAGVWLYDKTGFSQVQQLANEDNPTVALEKLHNYQKFHPTRHLLAISSRQQETQLEKQLEARVKEQRRTEMLSQLQAMREDIHGINPSEVTALFASYRREYPEHALSSDMIKFEEEAIEFAVQRDIDELIQLEGKLPADELPISYVAKDVWREGMLALIDRSQELLKKHEGLSNVEKIRQRHESYVSRLDHHDFEIARNYSVHNPLNFQTRRERYQTYLDRHPQGVLLSKANEAIKSLERAWDNHDFRAVRDHFQNKPKELDELTAKCERYQLVHPTGRYVAKAKELLRWVARIKGQREYKVTLVGGEFHIGKTRRWYTKGPDLALTIEVNGERHGPSNIVVNSYYPQWKYEFPRPIRWKVGDRVRIIVTDFDYWNVKVLDYTSDANDPFALRLLSGHNNLDGHKLHFTSDFWLPTMPEIE